MSAPADIVVFHDEPKDKDEPNETSVVIKLHPELFRLLGYLFFWTMVVTTVIVTKYAVDPTLVNDSLLIATFGYNNICVNFDFEPARTVGALIWPIAEYVLVVYCVLNGLSFYFLYKRGELPKYQMIVVSAISPLQALTMIYFRMIFVEEAPDGVGAHTAGFLSLQWGLCLIAMQNYWYTHALGVVPVNYRLGIFYVVFLFCLTLLKQILAISSIEGNPIWCVDIDTCPSGAKGAQAIDVTWMLAVAVLPAFLSFLALRHTPPLTITLTGGFQKIRNQQAAKKEAAVQMN